MTLQNVCILFQFIDLAMASLASKLPVHVGKIEANMSEVSEISEQNTSIICSRCGSEMKGKFCSNCGQAKTVKRIDGTYILSEIASVLNFNKGILFTLRELLLRPGPSIQKFILEDRNRLVKPILFIIVCSLVYTILQQVLNFEDGYVNYSFDTDTTSSFMFTWISNNYGYTNILISLFIALWIKVFFRKQVYNYFEILVVLCFVMGTGMLIFSFWGIVDSLINFKIIDKGFFIGVVYISWGIGQFFNGNTIGNSFKGFLSYMLGFLSFALTIQVIGSFIDWLLA